jgi:hypothetical protein
MLLFLFSIKRMHSPAPVAHAYIPSYLGGRDQEDRSLKSAGTNSLQDPILKIPNTKRVGKMVQVVEYLPVSMRP